jgi:glutamate mutase epsilon subunit
MNISFLSADIKDQILNKYQSTNNKNIKDLMKFMMTQTEHNFTDRFIEFNKQKDKVRNQNFKDVFPEWSKVINYE